MKLHFGKIISIVLFLSLLVGVIPASAIDSSISYLDPIEYHLNSSTEQSFTIADSDGTPIYITIIPLQTNSRIATGSYKINYTKKNCWTANFIVAISNNRIISAHSPVVTAITGIIDKYNLTVELQIQAKLQVFWKQSPYSPVISNGVKAFITTDNTLQVTPF